MSPKVTFIHKILRSSLVWKECVIQNRQTVMDRGKYHNALIRVEPYSIHGSILKLEYLKTELNEDNGTYAIVKVTSHSCRIMVNLSIRDYFEVMRHP